MGLYLILLHKNVLQENFSKFLCSKVQYPTLLCMQSIYKVVLGFNCTFRRLTPLKTGAGYFWRDQCHMAYEDIPYMISKRCFFGGIFDTRIHPTAFFCNLKQLI